MNVKKIIKNNPRDSLIGDYKNCYLGFFNNNQIRYNLSSSGIIRQTLIYLLEKKTH